MKKPVDPIDLGVYWARLVAITAEAGTAFRRAAFSTIVTENLDFAVALFSAKGELVAQPNAGFAAFAGTLSRTIPKMLAELQGDIHPGDVYITNDAWLGASQLNDYFFLTPVHHRGRLVAFAATVAHSQEVGGSGQLSTRTREIYGEGIQVPVSRFISKGRVNDDLLKLIARNVRVPELVSGDFFSQVAANNVMATRLVEFLDEMPALDLEGLFDEMLERAEQAMLEAVRRLPDGVYGSEIQGEGPDGPFPLKVSIHIDDGTMHLDFTGSAEQSPYAINCTENFSIGRALAPLVTIARPGGYVNGGSYRHIRMSIPEGCILNARYPAATSSRLLSSGLVGPLIFDALSTAAPGVVLAGCAAPVWGPAMVFNGPGRTYGRVLLISGGMGARPDADGISCLTFPDSMTSVRPEVTEEDLPLSVLAQEFAEDSGGAGRYRGGLGQRVVMRSESREPIRVSLRIPRLGASAKGLLGGQPGAKGRIFINGLEQADGTADVVMNFGDVIEFRTPGGGGHGDPRQREKARVKADLEAGKISTETARRLYGYEPRRYGR